MYKINEEEKESSQETPKKKVLIVDDDAFNLYSMKSILSFLEALSTHSNLMR